MAKKPQKAEPKPAEKPKAQAGRPAFEPTDADRKMVETLAGYGLQQKQIACLVINPQTSRPIDEKTLRDKFRDELDVGMARGDSAVLQSLFHQAVGRPAQYDENKNLIRAELAPIPSATIFSAKARPGIKMSERHEITGANGGAIQHAGFFIDPEKLKHMSEPELAALERAIGRLQRGDGGDPGRAPGAANENDYAATMHPGKGKLAT